MHTFQHLKMRFEILKHAEIRMFENVVEDIPPVVLGTRVEQRLHRDAVCEQKDDAQQCEVEQFNHLQYITVILIHLQTTSVSATDLGQRAFRL